MRPLNGLQGKPHKEGRGGEEGYREKALNKAKTCSGRGDREREKTNLDYPDKH